MEGVKRIYLCGCFLIVLIDATSEKNASLLPAEAYVFEDESVNLTCVFPQTPTYVVIWQTNNLGYAQVSYDSNNNNNCHSEKWLSGYGIFCNESAVIVNIVYKNDSDAQLWKCRWLPQNVIPFAYVYSGVRLKRVDIAINTQTIKENGTVFIICTSTPSRPNATILLYKSKDNQPSVEFPEKDVRYHTDYIEEKENLWTAVTHFSFVASRQLNNWNVHCLASNDPLNKIQITSEKKGLNVQYPPKGPPVIENDIENGSNYLVIEQKEYVLKCSIGESNPPAELTWTCDKSMQIISVQNSSSTAKSMTCVSVSRTNAHCTCESQHDIGSAKKVLINMISLYKPGVPELYVNGNAVKSIAFIENTTGIVNCSSDGMPNPNITWSQNDSIIAYDQALHLAQVSRTRDGELFTCNSKNIMQDSKGYTETGISKRTMTLEVLFPPTVAKLNTTSIVEGTNVVILCQAKAGKPIEMTFRWTNASGTEVSQNNSLAFVNISRKDRQMFTCAVNNNMTSSDGRQQMGFSNSSFELDVLFPVEKVKAGLEINNVHVNYISKRISIIETSQLLILTCSADGNPIPVDFTWTGSLETRSSIIQMTALRTIAGNYTCIARNTMKPTNGHAQTSQMNETYEIDILYPPEIENIQELKVIERQDYNIKCLKTSGKTTSLSFKWIKDNHEPLMSDNSSLNILNVSRNYAGRYGCFIQYEMKPTYGNSTIGNNNSSFAFIVLYPPELLNISLEIDTKEAINITRSVSVIENASLVLNCSSLGNPLPSNYSWTGYQTNIYSAILQLKVTRNSGGSFTCTAKNKMDLSNGTSIIGQISQTFEIDVQYPPELKEERYITSPEGKDVTLTCVLHYGRTVHSAVRWISSNGTTIQEFDNLSLYNVTRSSSGNYTCETTYTMAPSYRDPITAFMAKTVYLEVTYATNDKENSPSGGGNAGQVAGGVIGGLLGIGAIVAAVFLVRRRLHGKQLNTANNSCNLSLSQVSLKDSACTVTADSDFSHVYEKLQNADGACNESADGGICNNYEKLQNAGNDQQYQQLKTVNRMDNKGQHIVYENLRI